MADTVNQTPTFSSWSNSSLIAKNPVSRVMNSNI